MLILTSIHMTPLGALLALGPRPFYGIDEVTGFGVVLDAGQQLGWAMKTEITAQLLTDAFIMAIWRRGKRTACCTTAIKAANIPASSSSA